MIRAAKHLARDERGATIIEMGFALPMLGLMLVGVIDLSRAYADKLRLEQAAQSTIETVQQQGYSHSTTSNPTSLGALEDEAEARAGTGAVATGSAYIECRTTTGKTEIAFTGTCPVGQTSARYVKVSIAKTYTPMFGFEFAGADANGNYDLVGESALRIQ
jgi:Flp pilus assembly protein TadG